MGEEEDERFNSEGTRCTKEAILDMLPTDSSVLRAYCTSTRGPLLGGTKFLRKVPNVMARSDERQDESDVVPAASRSRRSTAMETAS